MKLGKPKDWVFANGNFSCECLKCEKIIRETDPRYIPIGFRVGRLCVKCYLVHVEKQEVN